MPAIAVCAFVSVDSVVAYALSIENIIVSNDYHTIL